jgi:nicotinamidase-related amidase
VPEPLLVVDVQNCFINDYTRDIPAKVAQLLASNAYDPLIFTRFVNPPESPFRRLLEWHECESEPGTTLVDEIAAAAENGKVFVKQGHAGVSDELREHLREQGFDHITLVGIDTDMCVLKTAMDIFDLGIAPIVLSDCCASTAGLQAHLAGLAILSRNIGPHQLRPSGLGGSEIAAPEASTS